MIFFRQFNVCRKYCTDSVVSVTAVGINWGSGWMSITERDGLTTQPLPRVSGDMVGFTPTCFKDLEGNFQPSTPPVFIVFVISLHTEVDTTMGQLI